MMNKSELVLYSTPNGQVKVNLHYNKESFWLSQKQMSELFGKNIDTISLHLKNIYTEGELDEKATTEDYSVVQKEGNRNVRRTITEHLKKIFEDGELDENSVCRDFRHTASDSKEYVTKFYNLKAITAVGYRVNFQ